MIGEGVTNNYWLVLRAVVVHTTNDYWFVCKALLICTRTTTASCVKEYCFVSLSDIGRYLSLTKGMDECPEERGLFLCLYLHSP